MDTGKATDTGMGTDTALAPPGPAHLPLLPRHRWEQLLLTAVIYAQRPSQLYLDVAGIARASRFVRFQGKWEEQINS